MHELGIMTGVMESVEEAARNAGATKVLEIDLSVGVMTEAVEDALRFAFEALSEGTMCEGGFTQLIAGKEMQIDSIEVDIPDENDSVEES